MESFPNLNVVEIEFAFRANAVEIKDWGKEANLSLITEVLNCYQYDRREEVQKPSESLRIASQSHILTDDDYDNEARAEIEAFYQYKRQGKKNPLKFDFWGELMVKDGILKRADQFDKFIEESLKNNKPAIYERVQS